MGKKSDDMAKKYYIKMHLTLTIHWLNPYKIVENAFVVIILLLFDDCT